MKADSHRGLMGGRSLLKNKLLTDTERNKLKYVHTLKKILLTVDNFHVNILGLKQSFCTIVDLILLNVSVCA